MRTDEKRDILKQVQLAAQPYESFGLGTAVSSFLLRWVVGRGFYRGFYPKE